jgi:malate permease and related proteins
MPHVLETILPIFAIIGLAYWLGRTERLTRPFLSELNWLVFWVCLPALIVHSLATVRSLPAGTLQILLIFGAGTLVIIALSLAAVRWLGLPRTSLGTFVQATMRGNLAFIGLPILVFAMREKPPEVLSEVVAQTMFVFAPSVVFYNVVSVTALVGSRDGFSVNRLGALILEVAKNPLILACLVGGVLFLLPLRLPAFGLSTLDLVGRMAAPAALFCVGGAMAGVSMAGRRRSAFVAAALKCLLLPALTAGLSSLAGLDGNARLILLVLSACPVAITSYVMAKELDGDEALAAGSIVVSTLLSIPVLFMILILAA